MFPADSLFPRRALWLTLVEVRASTEHVRISGSVIGSSIHRAVRPKAPRAAPRPIILAEMLAQLLERIRLHFHHSLFAVQIPTKGPAETCDSVT
jgi:hypothetical protein